MLVTLSGAGCPQVDQRRFGAASLVGQRGMVPDRLRLGRDVPAARRGQVDQRLENVAACKVASKVGARALLLNHFVPVAFDPDALVAEVTADFAGPVVIGEDLLSIDVPGRTIDFERLRVALGSA